MVRGSEVRVEMVPEEKMELRRDVTVWGSYMWGYADVGADIYAALGLVMAASHGGASLAFGVAGIIYIMIGLAYTELASAYPVAGGGPYFTLRGLEIAVSCQMVFGRAVIFIRSLQGVKAIKSVTCKRLFRWPCPPGNISPEPRGA